MQIVSRNSQISCKQFLGILVYRYVQGLICKSKSLVLYFLSLVEFIAPDVVFLIDHVHFFHNYGAGCKVCYGCGSHGFWSWTCSLQYSCLSILEEPYKPYPCWTDWQVIIKTRRVIMVKDSTSRSLRTLHTIWKTKIVGFSRGFLSALTLQCIWSSKHLLDISGPLSGTQRL